MSDPLNDALHDALLGVLLGRTNVHQQTVDVNGNVVFGNVTIQSAFEERIRERARKGEFDNIIDTALQFVDTREITAAFETLFAKALITSLKTERGYWGDRSWLQDQARNIAVEACKAAVSEDEDLKDRLRTMISSEVDRNRVGITVSLSDPEK